MAARCVGVFSKIAMLETMNSFLERVLPWLAAIDDCTKQEGAIEALACILSRKASVNSPCLWLLSVLDRLTSRCDGAAGCGHRALHCAAGGSGAGPHERP